jgi:hypothetical protein
VKPTSIVSLIIAVLLIILGLVTCMIAQNMATANGEFLFSETREDGLVNTVDLTESEVSKIELIVSDAEINIMRGDKACIEFVNFRENYYNLSAANRVLSFSEIPDITSMLKFWENGFTFKGMRYILNFKKDQEQAPDAKKIINLYLTNDKEIKIFDIQADNCTLNIENMTSATDYNITVNTAEITLTSLKTASNININAKDGDKPAQSVTLNMNRTLAANVNVAADELIMDAKVYRCNVSTNIVCDTGSVAIESAMKADALKMNLDTVSGKVLVDGAEQASPYTTTTANAEDAKLQIITDSADIRITYAGSSAEAPAEGEEP